MAGASEGIHCLVPPDSTSRGETGKRGECVKITGVIFLLVGINDTLTYWFL